MITGDRQGHSFSRFSFKFVKDEVMEGVLRGPQDLGVELATLDIHSLLQRVTRWEIQRLVRLTRSLTVNNNNDDDHG